MRKYFSYPQRSLAIDLLRGLSILLVMLLHDRTGDPEYSKLLVVPPWLINPLAYNGALGVSAFFTISGYLITAITLRRDGAFNRIRIGRFYLFRATRILPPLLSLIALNLVAHACGAWGFDYHGMSLGRLLAAVVTCRFNVLYLAGAMNLTAWAVLWSLSIEEAFYLVFPLFARILRAEWLIVTVLAAIVIQGPFYRHAHGEASFYLYWSCFDLLALGCLTAIASRRLTARQWPTSTRRTFQGVGLAAFVGLCYGVNLHTPSNWVLLPSGIAFASAIFLLGCPMDGKREPERRPRWVTLLVPVCLIGYLSYELYLFYAPIMLLLRRPLHALAQLTHGFMPRDLMVLVLIAFSTVICGLVHTTCYEPLQRWARRPAQPAE